MKTEEKIPVFIDIRKGKTVCICHAGRKGCDKKCDRDFVSRDKYFGWKHTMKKDVYGK